MGGVVLPFLARGFNSLTRGVDFHTKALLWLHDSLGQLAGVFDITGREGQRRQGGCGGVSGFSQRPFCLRGGSRGTMRSDSNHVFWENFLRCKSTSTFSFMCFVSGQMADMSYLRQKLQSSAIQGQTFNCQSCLGTSAHAQKKAAMV